MNVKKVEPRDRPATVLFREPELEWLKQLMFLHKRTLSSFMRDAVLKEAQRLEKKEPLRRVG